MANLPLAFAELLAGGILITAGASDPNGSIASVVQGLDSGKGIASFGTGSSSTPTSTTPQATADGYVNPFPGASSSRVDQGVDYTITQPVKAPGTLAIKHVGNISGFGTYIAGQLLDGPLAGRGVYFAEGLAPAAGVTPGAVIPKGADVAVPAQGPYGHGVIESGWADIKSSWYAPLAQSTGGFANASTAAGASYNRFVQALGGPLGHLEGTIRGNLAGMGLP